MIHSHAVTPLWLSRKRKHQVTLANLRRVAEIPSVWCGKVALFAHASLTTSVVHLIADLNVPSVRSVPQTKRASVRSVVTHALRAAAPTLNVTLSITRRSVAVFLDTKATPSLDAAESLHVSIFSLAISSFLYNYLV